MCHDPYSIKQLQDDLVYFTSLAEAGDRDAAGLAERTALELQALGVKPERPTRPLFENNKPVDARLKELSPRRTRMGFVRT